MSGSPPPPPPPHGEAPKTTAGGGSGLPPGKYDVFIIPDHSAGAGFLYLPSLRTNTNSFIAGFASALLAVVLGQTLAPAFQTWWANFQGMGNAGMALLVVAVGLGAWSLGRLTSDSSGRGAGSWGGGGFYSDGPSMPAGGFSGAGPSAHGSPPPNAGPTPGAHSPPPSGGPNPGTNNPEGSYERPPEPPPKTQQTKPKPQAEPSKKTWEKAREEVRRKEEERKAKEAEDKRRAEEDKRRAEAAQRLKELREKEARERAQREVERARREQEAREKAAKEQEARDKEAREKEAKERKEKELREAREKELKERLARDREERRKRVEEADRKRKQDEAEKKRREEEAERTRREEIAEKIRREEIAEKRRREEAAEMKRREEAAEKKRREEAAEKKRREEAAEKKRREEEEVLLARKSSTYAFSGVGEKLNPWPNGKPPSVAPSAPSAARSSVSTPPPSAKSHPPPTASNVGDDSDAYSYRPYDQPKRPARRTSNSDMSESSWAPSQSTTRTTPPPSVRTGYATKDPDKIVIKGVYCFMNQYAKTPASQLISGMGTVTDGLILRITTEGLFIDDDVRGVAQREWDVKAWTLKLVEVWCPMHFLIGAIDANSPLPPNGSRTHKASSSASNASTSFFAKMVGGSARLRDAERGTHKVMTDDVADEYLTNMLRSCKDSCRLGDCASKFAASNLPNTSATPHDDASSVMSGSTRDTNSTVQTGDWKARGIHLLRATIRDQEGKRYLFVFGEEEGWKLALGLQRLRRGTQARALGVSALSGIETKTTLDMLGWG